MVQKVMPFINTAKEVARPRLAIFLRYAKVGCRVAGMVMVMEVTRPTRWSWRPPPPASSRWP